MTQKEQTALLACLESNPHTVSDLVGKLTQIVKALPVAKPKKPARKK